MAFSLRRRRCLAVLGFALALGTSASGPIAHAQAQAQLTFSASADSRVKSTSPTKSYGSDRWLTIGRGKKPTDPISLSFIKFDVSGITGAGTVNSATLRLLAKDRISYGANVLQVTNDWTEPALTWNT